MIIKGKPDRFTTMQGYGRFAGMLLIGTLALIGVALGSIFMAVILTIVGVLVCYLTGAIYFSPIVIFSLIGIGIIILLTMRKKNE